MGWGVYDDWFRRKPNRSSTLIGETPEEERTDRIGRKTRFRAIVEALAATCVTIVAVWTNKK